MKLIISDNDLIITKELSEQTSCYDLLKATYEILNKLYDKKTVLASHNKIYLKPISKSNSTLNVSS